MEVSVFFSMVVLEAVVSVILVLILQIYVVPKLLHWHFPGQKPYNFFLGGVNELKKYPITFHIFLREEAKKYGPVFQLWIMQARLVREGEELSQKSYASGHKNRSLAFIFLRSEKKFF